MTKGWKGERQRHQMASRGISTKHKLVAKGTFNVMTCPACGGTPMEELGGCSICKNKGTLSSYDSNWSEQSYYESLIQEVAITGEITKLIKYDIDMLFDEWKYNGNDTDMEWMLKPYIMKERIQEIYDTNLEFEGQKMTSEYVIYAIKYIKGK